MSFKQKLVFLKSFTVKYQLSLYFTVYNIADFQVDMTKSTLKKKRVLSTNGLPNKCSTNVETLIFKDQCRENTRKQIEALKLGKFVVNGYMTIKVQTIQILKKLFKRKFLKK